MSQTLYDRDGRLVFQGTSAGFGGSLPSGSGSPAGVVTPSDIGSLYVDSDAGGLYIAIGATSADWIAVGGHASAALPGTSVDQHGNAQALAGDTWQAFLSSVTAYSQGKGIVWNKNGDNPGDEIASIIVTSGAHDFPPNGSYVSPKGIIFPTADPHIAGAWWDNAGVLTKSAG